MPIDGRAELAGQQLGFARRPRRALAGDDEQAAAALDEPLQRAAAAAGRQHRVVQDDDRALVERRRRHARRPASTSTWNAGVVPIAERLRQIQARVGAIAAVDDQHRHRLARREHEVERVVGRQRIGAGVDRAAHVRLGQRELARR